MVRERNAWMEASEVISMFPTFVWKFQLRAGLRDLLEQRVLRILDSTKPALRRGEGWQSVQTLHEREDLRELATCVRDSAQSILRFLRIGYDAVEITGCWANVLAPGAAHRTHSHPNNFLSGVYYVRTPAGTNSINFHDPRIQARVIRPPIVELTAGNTDQVVVKVSSGTLLLFPAYLEHSVDANTSGEERISLSFNLMFSAFAENLAKPLW